MIFLIPHYGVEGGAGIYISSWIAELTKKDAVIVGGDFNSSYVAPELKKCSVKFSSKLIYPAYRGVSPLSKLYWLFISLVYLFPFCITLLFNLTKLKSSRLIVLTSVVQIPLLVVMKLFFRRSKFILMIQEEMDLGQFGSKSLIKFAGQFVDKYVCITQSMHKRLSEMNLPTEYVPNSMQMIPVDSFDEKQHGHLLYVGGGSDLKGYSLVLQMYLQLSSIRTIVLTMVGNYSDQQKEYILQLGQSNLRSKIIFVGHVGSIASLLGSSYILLLPIAAPHFCRPAIEAGLHAKTYVISGFKELSDFAIPSFNCLSFEPGSVSDFVDKVVDLLDSIRYARILSVNNFLFSRSYCINVNFSERVRQVIG